MKTLANLRLIGNESASRLAVHCGLSPIEKDANLTPSS